MARRKKTRFETSARENNRAYGIYLMRLTELAISMFEWKNLPDSIDPRFLELTLFTDGQAVFFQDEELGYLALQCIINGQLNVYRIPIQRRAFAVNGYQRQLNIDNSVIIYNNLMHVNSEPDIRYFARRLWNLDRIIDVNVNAQKTPVLIQSTEEQRLTMLNLYKEYDGNVPVIMGDKNLDINGMKALKTDAPYVADKIYDLKGQIWNEALTYLGISNINIQKKERLVSDEVTRSMGGTIASRHSRLESRRQACEQINKMFGLDVEVDYREDYREMDGGDMLPNETEGKDTDE
ncbi:MAG: hypothetical protein UE295_03810 [Acutalibacteraceae bacterium]|nr:hypothetical protein [Acutalibacteraceae bacterium]